MLVSISIIVLLDELYCISDCEFAKNAREYLALAYEGTSTSQVKKQN